MYEDYFDEYECDLIVNNKAFLDLLKDFKSKCDDLLVAKFKSQIEDLKRKAKELNAQEIRLFKQENEIDKKSNELKKLTEDYDNKHDEIITKYLYSKYNLDIKPGTKVYYIVKDYDYEECPVCKGNKKIQVTSINDNTLYDMYCPKCNGYGRINKYNCYVSEDIVRSVSITLTNFMDDGVFKPHSTELAFDSETQSNIAYNIVLQRNRCTYTRKEIYLTKEEAQAKCDMLNQIEKFEEEVLN